MDIHEKIKTVFVDCMADAFMKEKDFIASNLHLRFREDLAANSMMYFPLIGGIEEELDITIGFREFQNECHTLQQGLDFVTKAYIKQKGI